MNEFDVTVAERSVGFVGDVSVITDVAEDIVVVLELVALTTRKYEVLGINPVKVALPVRPSSMEGVAAVPLSVYV